MATILLTDPEQRASLAAARSLAHHGWRVVTLGASRGLAGRSRAVSGHCAASGEDLRSIERYRIIVATAVKQENIDVVLPISDSASRALLGLDDILGARVAGPSLAAYERASDKASLLNLASSLGIRVPSQYLLSDRDSLGSVRHAIAGSAVLKPTRSVVEVAGRSISLGVKFVSDVTEIESALDNYPQEAYPILVQERTFGDGVGLFLLRTNGQTHLQFAHRRLREKPPAGGISTYREAIAPPPILLKKSELLLDSLAYSGAAMIEFKHDAKSGEYILMEINARLWGSLQLAIDAGVNFPNVLADLALHGKVSPQPPARVGVRSVWELGELDHALALVRHSREKLHAPASMETGWRAAARVILDHRFSDYPEVFRWDDPLPFAAELIRWLRRI